MESSLKQRIYENILKFMENYRYIKSTAEATIPNFIFQNSPLLSLNFYLGQWRLHQFAVHYAVCSESGFGNRRMAFDKDSSFLWQMPVPHSLPLRFFPITDSFPKKGRPRVFQRGSKIIAHKRPVFNGKPLYNRVESDDDFAAYIKFSLFYFVSEPTGFEKCQCQ